MQAKYEIKIKWDKHTFSHCSLIKRHRLMETKIKKKNFYRWHIFSLVNVLIIKSLSKQCVNNFSDLSIGTMPINWLLKWILTDLSCPKSYCWIGKAQFSTSTVLLTFSSVHLTNFSQFSFDISRHIGEWESSSSRIGSSKSSKFNE